MSASASSVSSRISLERGVSQAESWAVIACCTLASAAAIIWSWRHDAMLNYGDAVAHLHIARRVFDARTPRFSQLGSVWLPLPHILLIPFVQDYQWWATGLAGVIPSALAYIAACAGVYHLVRRFASPAASALALAFFALNPNLLYLQTTAMTEPLFLCEFIWIVFWMIEIRDALEAEFAPGRPGVHSISFAPSVPPPNVPAGFDPHSPIAASLRKSLDAAATAPRLNAGPLSPIAASVQRSVRMVSSAAPRRRGAWLSGAFTPDAVGKGIFAARSNFAMRSSRLMSAVAVTLAAAIFTRYDGWIIAAIAWAGLAIALWSQRRLSSLAFWLLTIPVAAAPILWFIYNSVCFGDWLYFARGPFSAKAIELRTATPGAWPPHPGWHSLHVSFFFFLQVSQLDSIAPAVTGNKLANIVLAVAFLGTIAVCVGQKKPGARRAAFWILLLWLPVPFYAWSVAYGSVPIFFPNWWPYTLYNTRYGIELLPALAVGLGLATQSFVDMLHRLGSRRFPSGLVSRIVLAPAFAAILFVAAFSLTAFNLVELFQDGPLVYLESTRNLDARLPYDENLPPVLADLLSLLPHAPVLMDTSAYPEIVAFTGIPLRQTINESDLEIFRAALAAPARSAAIIVAFDGDDIDRAVKADPQDLAVAGRFTANTQPPATVYFSTKWIEQSPLMKTPQLTGPLLKDLTPPAGQTAPESTAP